MLLMFHHYDYKTEIIVASVRTVTHVIESAEMGAHIATIPPAILWKMFQSPLTDVGLEKFLKDAGVK